MTRSNLGVPGVVEEVDGGLAGGLGRVHGGVGVAEQGLSDRARLGDGDAHTAGDRHDGAVHGHRFRERLQHLVGDGIGRCRVAEILAADHELVPAESGHDVAVPQDLGQGLSDESEDLVATDVAEPVVHRLEVVEVDEQHRHQGLVAGAARNSVVEMVDEEPAVRETRERIVQGLECQALLEVLPFGDVEGCAHDAVGSRDR